MVISAIHQYLMYSIYFAPRGKERLMQLGQQIGARYLSPLDNLIGVIGDAGAGKSLLIKGVLPGLELTNDEGFNVRPSPLVNAADTGRFTNRSYHLDIRFELAFHQPYQIAEAIKKALKNGRRIVAEHFDLIYPFLELNADILIGIGGEVIVTRPTLFGPRPEDLANIVFESIKYRRMAHTAEDLTTKVLEEEFNVVSPLFHSDVKDGFLLCFPEKYDIDLKEVEKRVNEYVKRDLLVRYADEGHIRFGDGTEYPCTGPRIHVNRTGEIKGFRILKDFIFDPPKSSYLLVGMVGIEGDIDENDINRMRGLSK